MNGSEAAQLTLVGDVRVTDVLCPNFIHTTHFPILYSILFNSREVNSNSNVIPIQYVILDATFDLLAHFEWLLCHWVF